MNKLARRAVQSKRRLNRVAQIANWLKLKNSSLFDADWYLNRYDDVAKSGISPFKHYLLYGGEEGRDPSADFDSRDYLMRYPDVALNRVNPLIHYIRHGKSEGRLFKPSQYIRDTAMVLQSGLFDQDWYRKNVLPAESSIDPVKHYLEYGSDPQISPGPLFDAAAYIADNPSAYGSNLLLHFLYADVSSATTARPQGVRVYGVHSNRIVTTIPRPFESQNFRIACVVHAYYMDVFEEICSLLQNIPCQFTLLVSTVSSKAQQEASQLVEKYNLNAQFSSKVCLNRGRNFGPMFAEFSEQISDHDLVLHLHTKKSLYSGNEQKDWRNSLYGGLVGSKGLVSLILSCFKNEQDIGLVYPKAYENMPYWAHHWLSNHGSGSAFFQRIGIPNAVNSGMIDYPVGGMFWARVDSIRPILNAKLQYDDFPEEAGQTDGTLAHAIERGVSCINSYRGYKFVEIDYPSGILRRNWSERNLHQYQNNSCDSILHWALRADVVSFDIFDTLLIRPTLVPDSVLKYVGFELFRQHKIEDFFEKRKTAEVHARAKKDFCGDVNLLYIYQSLREISGWSETQIQIAYDVEIEMELSVILPRPDMLHTLKSVRGLNKRIICISDTYYTEEIIRQLLEKCGYGGFIDHLYLSSVEEARKDRGDLWSIVLEKEEITPDRLFHIGDNEQSDIQATSDRGIPHGHTMHPATLLKALGFGAHHQPAKATWATHLVMGPVMQRLAGSPFRNGHTFKTTRLSNAEDVGFTVFGPIVFTFLSWLVSHPAISHLPHINFLAREGYLLHRIYEAIRLKYPTSKLKPSHYLHVSRRAVLSACQSIRFDPGQLTEGAGFKGTVASFLKNRVGIELDKSWGVAEWEIRLPEDRDILVRALETLREPIVEHSKLEADRLLRYCISRDLTPDHIGAVVDIGYSATIQKGLQRLLGTPLVGFYFGTWKTAIGVEETGGYAYGCFDDENDPWRSKNPVLQNSLLMESFLTAPHGQVLCIDEINGELVPKFKELEIADEAVNILNDLHSGAMRYCLTLLDAYGPDLLFTNISLLEAQEPLRMLVEGQLTAPSEVFQKLSVEDEFCGNGHLPVGTKFLQPHSM